VRALLTQLTAISLIPKGQYYGRRHRPRTSLLWSDGVGELKKDGAGVKRFQVRRPRRRHFLPGVGKLGIPTKHILALGAPRQRACWLEYVALRETGVVRLQPHSVLKKPRRFALCREKRVTGLGNALIGRLPPVKRAPGLPYLAPRRFPCSRCSKICQAGRCARDCDIVVLTKEVERVKAMGADAVIKTIGPRQHGVRKQRGHGGWIMLSEVGGQGTLSSRCSNWFQWRNLRSSACSHVKAMSRRATLMSKPVVCEIFRGFSGRWRASLNDAMDCKCDQAGCRQNIRF